MDRLTRGFARLENALTLFALAAMTVLPLMESAGRKWFGGGIAGSFPIVQHLTLATTFIGATLAARSERHLALSTLRLFPERWQQRIRTLTSALGVAVVSSLFVASWELVRVDYTYGDTVAWGIPVWLASAIMPIGFAVILVRWIWHASDKNRGRLLAATGLLVPILFNLPFISEAPALLVVAGIGLIVGTLLGMPIFAAIGGIALLALWQEGTPISAVPGETYRLSTDPMLPAIPLFTVAGYILAEGGASRRLLDLFSAWVGWIPGGMAIATTLVLAFFTPLTGASGITILSMGGLLYPILTRAHYPETTATGLVTVSGSIGLLLPPSLPVILYAYYAEIEVTDLFIGGIVPGILLVTMVAGWGAYRGWSSGAERTSFDARRAVDTFWKAKWELAIPVLVLGAFFGGFSTLVESAALTVLSAFLVECVLFRDLSVTSDLPDVIIESATLVGGFMIILGVALGFSNYLVLAQVPMHTLSWVQSQITSPLLFLLALNLLLIVVGALMDIYSAILVIVPLVAPLGVAYGIDPVHLGIIFLANMQLGYLMPPMGENLFLSAYRFDKPLSEIYLSTLPFVILLFIAAMLITYVPAMTLWALR